MKKNFVVLAWIMLSGCLGSGCLAQAPPSILSPVPPSQSTTTQNTSEIIVLIRHGEKTPDELGQLSCRGLNRALALPSVLIGKYGKPDYLFAPNPSDAVTAKNGESYSYVRPLATIEPTAIQLGMPVNTQIGLGDIKQLEQELTKPKYANSLIFVAWEHSAEAQFTKNLMTEYSKDASSVPDWGKKDFDMIFVIRLVHSGTTTTATFTVDHEGLNDKLSDSYPVH
jgi:hypothetical protein